SDSPPPSGTREPRRPALGGPYVAQLLLTRGWEAARKAECDPAVANHAADRAGGDAVAVAGVADFGQKGGRDLAAHRPRLSVRKTHDEGRARRVGPPEDGADHGEQQQKREDVVHEGTPRLKSVSKSPA